MFRKITKRFIVICNLATALVFLLACIAYYANPVTYWYIAFLGLGFPYLLLIIFLFLVGWIFFKSKWVYFNIVLLIIGFQSIKGVFAWHPLQKKYDVQQLDSNTLRVMHWNTMSFGEFEKDRVKGSENRNEMIAYIKEQQPDVLCFQEFFDSYHPEFSQNIDFITQKLGYPYYYYGKDYERWATVKNGAHMRIGFWGTIIFSKYAMTDTGKVSFAKDEIGKHGNICYATIAKNNKPVRILTTHLQSIRLRKTDYDVFDKIPTNEESTIEKSKSVFHKIKKAYTFRKQQADLIRAELDRVNIPQILTGDFNDVPNSYTYATIKSNMQDAFLKKGFGIGRTFSNISPTLRIDYILATKDLQILQFNKGNLTVSDHYPIIADFKLTN